MSARFDSRLLRRLSWLYLLTAILYFVFGIVLSYQVYAQTRVQNTLTLGPYESVPTGSDDNTVKAYYKYLQMRQLMRFSETYFWNPILFGWVYGSIGLALLLFYLFVYAWWGARSKRGDLYPVEVYNGYITERGGPAGAFIYGVYAVLLSYMIYYTVICVTFGQCY